MAKEKLYFRSIDHTTCSSLESHFDDARDEELTKITLVEAVPDDGTNGGDWRSKSLALPLMISTTLDGFYFANCVLCVRAFHTDLIDY
jgi:hypothetical protein